jgi:hypothetical protein
MNLLKQILPSNSYNRMRDTYWLLWDMWHGVETSGAVKLNSVNVVGTNRSQAVDYAPGTVRKPLEELSADYQRYGFIDFGSGKGKVLLEAAAYPFKFVEGVEFSPELHRIAEKNIRQYRGKKRCREVRSILGDATEFALPPGPLVLHFFHPFTGAVLASVVDNIRASAAAHPRDMIIICAGALMEKDGFDRLPGIQVLWRRKYNTAYRLPG